MTPYLVTLNTATPAQAGAALAEAVSKAPKAKCPYCHQPINTYQVAGATMIEYHRIAGANWTWCDGGDYNMSEAME